jgi:hypothetical protein
MQTTTKVPIRGRALMFGLNYAHIPESSLQGCINDVKNMSDYLKALYQIPCDIYTDDVDRVNTSAIGMIQKLYELACISYRDDLELVWIHYSGHGTFVRDMNGDERDGRDECIVPSDYKSGGVVPDDIINNLFKYFNPRTRIVAVFDCCHSATICDVKYSWEGPKRVTVENIACTVPARVITLSGCLDNQVSMDAYNVLGDNKFSGAMTSCLLEVLRTNPFSRRNVFVLIDALRLKLRSTGFTQIAKICSTHNLARDTVFLP